MNTPASLSAVGHVEHGYLSGKFASNIQQAQCHPTVSEKAHIPLVTWKVLCPTAPSSLHQTEMACLCDHYPILPLHPPDLPYVSISLRTIGLDQIILLSEKISNQIIAIEALQSESQSMHLVFPLLFAATSLLLALDVLWLMLSCFTPNLFVIGRYCSIYFIFCLLIFVVCYSFFDISY